MASPRAVAVKMAGAVTKIEKASTALAEKFGVEFAPLPNIARVEPEFAKAAQLEHIGNFLQSIAVASKSAKDADFVETYEVNENPAPKPDVPEAISTEEIPEPVKKAATAEPKRSKNARPKGQAKRR